MWGSCCLRKTTNFGHPKGERLKYGSAGCTNCMDPLAIILGKLSNGAERQETVRRSVCFNEISSETKGTLSHRFSGFSKGYESALAYVLIENTVRKLSIIRLSYIEFLLYTQIEWYNWLIVKLIIVRNFIYRYHFTSQTWNFLFFLF